jgi:hypothetical protein
MVGRSDTGKVVVFTNLTLDGVMQAPGRPDEDRRGGFEHGGRAAPYNAMSSASSIFQSICSVRICSVFGAWLSEVLFAGDIL